VSITEALIRRGKELHLLGFSVGECRFIVETFELVWPDFFCEWGTNVGNSARYFHETRVLLGLDCVMHSVEGVDNIPILRVEEEGMVRGQHVLDVPVGLHIGIGVEVALDLYAASGKSRPLFFLDGQHDDASVTVEIESIHSACPEGAMLLHDAQPSWTYPGPWLAAMRWLKTHPGYEAAETEAGKKGF